jgi:hypothetical protein
MAGALVVERRNRWRCCWVLLITIAIYSALEPAAYPQELRFRAYRMDVWRGRVAPLNLRSHPLARKFRTLIREQMRDAGVNFAGHYTMASMGCGTGCSITAIVDARNGIAYFPEQLNAWTGIVGDYRYAENEEPWSYHANSRLLRAIGREHRGPTAEEHYGPSGIYYYEWKNNRLRLVKLKPVGSYPDAGATGIAIAESAYLAVVRSYVTR